MTIDSLLNKQEVVVKPFTSVASVENELVEHRYLVIKDGDEFIGLLTPLDIVVNPHQLVIDCYTKKPAILEHESIDDVLVKMLRQTQRVLPVFNDGGRYLGSVTCEGILSEMCSLMRSKVDVTITNIVGDNEVETAKQGFLAEVSHNIRNPIQVIYSSAHFLQGNPSPKERDILINAILSSTKQINLLVNRLFSLYFER